MYSTHPFPRVCRRVCNFTPWTLIITCCTYLAEINPPNKTYRKSASQYLHFSLQKERACALHAGNIDKWHLSDTNSSRQNAADHQPLHSTLLCRFTAVQGVLQSLLCISVNIWESVQILRDFKPRLCVFICCIFQQPAGLLILNTEGLSWLINEKLNTGIGTGRSTECRPKFV